MSGIIKLGNNTEDEINEIGDNWYDRAKRLYRKFLEEEDIRKKVRWYLLHVQMFERVKYIFSALIEQSKRIPKFESGGYTENQNEQK